MLAACLAAARQKQCAYIFTVLRWLHSSLITAITTSTVTAQMISAKLPLHGRRLRTPSTDKNLPLPNILTCRDVGLWHCDVENLL